MKIESDLIKLIQKVETRQARNEAMINNSTRTKLFWQGKKCELDYLHLHLCKLLKKHQKRIN